jgi:hypothetical protein
MMKQLIACGAALFLAASAMAANIQLAWDNSPDTNVVTTSVYYGLAQGGTNLSTFGTTNQWAYGAVSTNIVATNGTVTVGMPTNTVSITLTNSGQLYWFFATAKDAWGNESDPSNVVFWKNSRPAKPGQVKQTVVIFFGGQ